METYGMLSLLPIAVVVVLVFLTRRTAVSLLAGGVVGAVILHGPGFAKPWVDLVYGVIGSDLWIWIVLVCGFFGSLIALFEASGGVWGFTDIAARFCTGARRTQVGIWFLSLLIFVDDWLSILSVEAAMGKTADRYRIPREMMAFLSSSAAGSICVLVPTSTWGVFMISQLVAAGLSAPEDGIRTFLTVLPMMFYPLLALLCGLLYALGVLPRFGPMKKAYQQSREKPIRETEETTVTPSSPWNFLAPVILITALTLATGEILYGTLACLVFCAVLYIPQKLLTPGTFLDTVLSGFKDMIGVLFIVGGAFILRDVNALLGMPEFVIGVARTAISPQLLPAVAFVLVAALAVAAGNFWGICAIAFPVIIPIAQALDGNLLLTAGAIISGTIAGANLCFFGSEVTLACAGAQIENVSYARTATPLLAVPVGLTVLCYLLAGFLMG